MNREPVRSVDMLSMHGIPYRISPMLASLLNSQIESLVYNANVDVRYGLIDPIKMVKIASSMDHLAYNWSTYISANTPRYQFISVARRVALGYFWRRTVRKCISKLPSTEAKESSRMFLCPPLGVPTSQYKCRSIFCPHCRMRLANSTRKQVLSNFPGADPASMCATVVQLDVPFKEKFYGFDAVLEDCLVGKIRRCLKDIPYMGVKTLGAKIKERRPLSTTSVAIIADGKDCPEVVKKLKSLKTRMFKNYPDWFMDIEEVSGLDNICLALYDRSPISLIGMSEDGLSNQSLQHTLDSYKAKIKSKKRISFFGTGVK